jgi:hypothetical protein
VLRHQHAVLALLLLGVVAVPTLIDWEKMVGQRHRHSVDPRHEPPRAVTVRRVFFSEFVLKERFLRVHPREQDGQRCGDD